MENQNETQFAFAIMYHDGRRLEASLASVLAVKGYSDEPVTVCLPLKRYEYAPEVHYALSELENVTLAFNMPTPPENALVLNEGDALHPCALLYVKEYGADAWERGCVLKNSIPLPVEVRENVGEPWLVSVIIPIYNVEKYLREAIDSVVAQTIGFAKNVQLILVNDGSPDGCGEICREYFTLEPKNVVYIEQENRGEGAARNAGLSAATGTFVAFLDADDVFERNYLETGIAFLNTHSDVCVVAFPLKLFGNASKDESICWIINSQRRLLSPQIMIYPLFRCILRVQWLDVWQLETTGLICV